MMTIRKPGVQRDSRTIPQPDRRVRVPVSKIGGLNHFKLTEVRHYSALLCALMWERQDSIRDVADRAGVGRATVWKHVGGAINWEYTRLSTVRRILGALGIELQALPSRASRSGGKRAAG